MQELVIEINAKSKTKKSRKFSATLMGYIVADSLWSGGQAQTRATRPIYLTVAGSESGLRPFLANLRRGKRADIIGDSRRSWDRGGDWMQLLKSAGYELFWQRGSGTTHLVTLFLREVFAVDPGLIDPNTCALISAPPQWWADEQLAKLQEDRELCGRILAHARRLHLTDNEKSTIETPHRFGEDEILRFVPPAAHFCLCLDKRTRRPLVNDLAYCLQLYLAALGSGIASRSKRHQYSWSYHKWADDFLEVDTGRLGLLPGAVVDASHETLDEFLTKQIQVYQLAGGDING